MEDVQRVLSDLNITAVVHDERCHGVPLRVTFQGSLRPEQKAAADSMLGHDIGVLAATTAFGKTVVAAWLIAERGVNTLVLVHRRQLLDQWVERLSTFLDINNREIGRIGGGRRKPTGTLDVAVIQSLVRKSVVDDRIGDYGQVIVDECHHLSAHSFEQVIGGPKQSSSLDCRQRSRARMAIIRSSSCSAVRCGIVSMRRPRRCGGLLPTAFWCVRQPFSRQYRRLRTSASSFIRSTAI